MLYKTFNGMQGSIRDKPIIIIFTKTLPSNWQIF